MANIYIYIYRIYMDTLQISSDSPQCCEVPHLQKPAGGHHHVPCQLLKVMLPMGNPPFWEVFTSHFWWNWGWFYILGLPQIAHRKNWGNNGLGYLDFRKHPHAGKSEKHSDNGFLNLCRDSTFVRFFWEDFNTLESTHTEGSVRDFHPKASRPAWLETTLLACYFEAV